MIELIRGDCLEEMILLEDKSVDLILCDPPYKATACSWDTVIPFEPMWKELKRIRKDNAATLLFGIEPFSSHLRMSNIKEFKYDWVWKKNKPTGMMNAKRMPMRDYELISVFYNKPCPYYPIKEPRVWKTKVPKNATYRAYNKNNTTYGKHLVTDRKPMSELRYPALIQSFDSILTRKSQVHPTQKPVALLEYLIKTYTIEGETVLDFTMGSGSTGVACKNLNRNFIGIEKDEKYFKIARERIGA